MNLVFTDYLRSALRTLEADGLLKKERVLTSPQGAWIEADGKRVVNLCANNYLGLAGHPDLVAAAREALPRYGYGLSSVRFICGTQDVHKALEARLARFLGFEDAILFSSCFDANGGVFEALLGEEDENTDSVAGTVVSNKVSMRCNLLAMPSWPAGSFSLHHATSICSAVNPWASSSCSSAWMRCTWRRFGAEGSRATRDRCCTVTPQWASPSTPSRARAVASGCS